MLVGSSAAFQQLRVTFQTSIANHYSKYEIFLQKKYQEDHNLLSDHVEEDAIRQDYAVATAVDKKTAQFPSGFIRRFLTFNSLLPPDQQWKLSPSFHHNVFVDLPESYLAQCLFSAKNCSDGPLQEILNSTRSWYLNKRELIEPGSFIFDFICNLGGEKNRRLKSKHRRGLIKINSIQTNGYQLSIGCIPFSKVKVNQYMKAQEFQLSPIETLLSKEEPRTEKELEDRRKYHDIIFDQFAKVTVTGFDAGVVNALAWSSIRPDGIVGFGTARSRSYYNQVRVF